MAGTTVRSERPVATLVFLTVCWVEMQGFAAVGVYCVVCSLVGCGVGFFVGTAVCPGLGAAVFLAMCAIAMHVGATMGVAGVVSGLNALWSAFMWGFTGTAVLHEYPVAAFLLLSVWQAAR